MHFWSDHTAVAQLYFVIKNSLPTAVGNVHTLDCLCGTYDRSDLQGNGLL